MTFSVDNITVTEAVEISYGNTLEAIEDSKISLYEILFQSNKMNTISAMIQYDYEEPNPIDPTDFPDNSNFTQANFSYKMAIFQLYIIAKFIILYKSGDIQYPSTELELITKILPILPISPSIPIIKKVLTYTARDTTSYGGLILEYDVGGTKISFILLRGTQIADEWYEDAQFILTHPDWAEGHPLLQVHHGFNNVYTKGSNSLREQIWDYITNNTINHLFICGHSLGAGISNLIAADITINKPLLRLKTRIYPIASPYSGNKHFVELINTKSLSDTYSGIFTVINSKDPVPAVRMPFYHRTFPQLFIFKHDGKSPGSTHFINTYIESLILFGPDFDICAPVSSICDQS